VPQTDLYGSLALTGRGHATDRAIPFGLKRRIAGQIDPAKIEPLVNGIRTAHSLLLGGIQAVSFDEPLDLLFHKNSALPAHPNGMSFRAFDERGIEILKECITRSAEVLRRRKEEMQGAQCEADSRQVPYPFKSAADLVRIGEDKQLAIWQIVLENEKSRRNESEIRSFVERIWNTMNACMLRGLETEGIWPGG